jgi:hypothetical protein
VVGVSEDLIGEYLAQLRAKLRAADADAILAEAEDHLRESVAAGLAVGLSEREAQQAASSSFGTVRAVIRAHQTRRGRAAMFVVGVTDLALPFLLRSTSYTNGGGGNRRPERGGEMGGEMGGAIGGRKSTARGRQAMV